MVGHATVRLRAARAAVVRGWRRGLRAAATCCLAAGGIALVFVVPPTVAGIADGLTRPPDVAPVDGGVAADVLRDVHRALQATGETQLYGPTWTVEWQDQRDHHDRSRVFVDESPARRFAEQVDGSVLVSGLAVPGDDQRFVVATRPGVVTDAAGHPAVEIVAADGTVLYRSDAVSADPFVTLCQEFDPTYWRFGAGVLSDVGPVAEGSTVSICAYRTPAQVGESQLTVLRWDLTRAGESFIGYWALALPVTVVGGLVIGRFRRRLRLASTADTPALVDNPRPDSLLGGITEDVNHSLTRARMSVEQQRAFVADAAHELRSPLASLITTLEVADRHPGIVDPREVTRTSLTQARRLERLTQDLLLLARVDARAALREDVVDLADVIREVVADTPGQGRPIRMTGVVATDVIGDRDAFRRVLRNLVDNAVRHAATEVEVRLSTVDGRARVEVGNDGTPIPDDQVERVFDRFTRLDDARARDAGGIGLGLAIARGVTERHGGTVTVLPGRRDGTTLVWELPIAR